MAHLSPYQPRRYDVRRVFTGIILTLALLTIGLIRLSVSSPPRSPEPLFDTALLLPIETAADRPDRPTDGPVYPYSIIPGGASSADALRASIASDPVVRAHYDGFDLSRTRVVRLSTARLAHVSYRVGSEVFWTRKALVIPAGETMLTDGVHYARTRCGNQLAATPGLVSGREPAVAELDVPLAPVADRRSFPLVALPIALPARESTLASMVQQLPMFGGGGVGVTSGFGGRSAGSSPLDPAATAISLEGDSSSSFVALPPTDVSTPPPSEHLPPSGLPPTGSLPPGEPPTFTPPPVDPPTIEHPPVDPPTDPPVDPPTDPPLPPSNPPVPPTDPPTHVPEPGTLGMLLAGGAVWLRPRRVRR